MKLMRVAVEQRVLTSWKEIGAYMGRGVRTVQRWEQHFGLPVRRPSCESHSAVMAFPEEIDAWVMCASNGKDQSFAEMERLRAEVERLQREVDRLQREMERLRSRPTGRDPGPPKRKATPLAA